MQKADEKFEQHQGNRQEVRHEVNSDKNDDLTREDITEKPERERNNANYLADELNDADRERDRRFERDEFACVLRST